MERSKQRKNSKPTIEYYQPPHRRRLYNEDAQWYNEQVLAWKSSTLKLDENMNTLKLSSFTNNMPAALAMASPTSVSSSTDQEVKQQYAPLRRPKPLGEHNMEPAVKQLPFTLTPLELGHRRASLHLPTTVLSSTSSTSDEEVNLRYASLRRPKSLSELEPAKKQLPFLCYNATRLGLGLVRAPLQRPAGNTPRSNYNPLKSDTLISEPSEETISTIKTCMERVILKGDFSAAAGAKQIIYSIEAEKKYYLFNYLSTVCEEWYDKRNCTLRNIKFATGTRFTDFMRFLMEMCVQLKQAPVIKNHAKIVINELLFILMRCCDACISVPVKCVVEVKCVVDVFSCVGKYLEGKFPMQMNHFVRRVKCIFLESSVSAQISKKLLHIIELRASSWALPRHAEEYYNMFN